MRWVLAFAVLAATLAVDIRGRAVAQDESAGGPVLGTPVPFVGSEGTEVARLTVEEAVDPFEEYDPAYPPESGRRYLLLRLTVENTGPRLLVFDPSQVVVQDTDGFLLEPVPVYRPQAETEADPDLAAQDLAPGAQASGPIGYSAIAGTSPARVFFRPDPQRLELLVDLATESDAEPVPAAGAGDAVAVVGTEGDEVAQIAVTAVVDRFDDYVSRFPPPPGSHFVLLGLTVENTGSQPLLFDPATVALRGADGVLYPPVSIQRSDDAVAADPDLVYGDIPPGEPVFGVVGFAVLNGAALVDVAYTPARDRLVLLADLGDASATGAPAADGGQPPPAAGAPLDAVGATSGVEGDSYVSPGFGYAIAWDGNVWQVGGEIVDDRYNALRLNTEISSFYLEGSTAFRGDAAACLADTVEGLEGNPAIEDLAPADDLPAPTVDGAPPPSAALFTYTLAAEDGVASELVYYVECRTLVAGESVLEISFVSPARFYDLDVPLATALRTEIRLPDPTARPPEAATPPAADDPSAGSDAAAGVAGNAYTSPTYGYAITWDAARWSVGEASSEDGTDFLRLDTEAITVLLEGFAATAGGADACLTAALDELANDPAVSNLAPATDLAAPTADGSLPENARLVTYAYFPQAGLAFDLVVYVECRPLAGDETALRTTVRTFARVYDQTLPEATALLSALTIT